jgi:hypothetical protein
VLDWNAAREAIRVAIRNAMGLPEGLQPNGATVKCVVWDGENDGNIYQPYPKVVLRQRRIKSWDDSIIDSTGPGNTLVTTHSGPRAILLEVRVESDDQHTSPAACQLSENFRTRIFRRAIQAALKTAGIGVGAMAETVEASYTGEEGRQYSVGITECWFNLAQNDVDTDAPQEWIEHVTYVSDKIVRPDGTDSPLQVDVTIPPIEV